MSLTNCGPHSYISGNFANFWHISAKIVISFSVPFDKKHWWPSAIANFIYCSLDESSARRLLTMSLLTNCVVAYANQFLLLFCSTDFVTMSSVYLRSRIFALDFIRLELFQRDIPYLFRTVLSSGANSYAFSKTTKGLSNMSPISESENMLMSSLTKDGPLASI